jgi:hypothetical protein
MEVALLSDAAEYCRMCCSAGDCCGALFKNHACSARDTHSLNQE